jgi:hypothetical protein
MSVSVCCFVAFANKNKKIAMLLIELDYTLLWFAYHWFA